MFPALPRRGGDAFDLQKWAWPLAGSVNLSAPIILSHGGGRGTGGPPTSAEKENSSLSTGPADFYSARWGAEGGEFRKK